ncbi:MAG: tetraacyldisaccharide 4'-kinase [Candidatus Omnitrophica bacterium]|nr:tetraacyldisaccharide 4'-kinase [Candidatus Omnitrophota bacterium]
MNRTLHDAWWRVAVAAPRSPSDRLLAAVLQAASGLYGTAVRARNAAYDRGWLRRERLSRPVISIGNLTVGGTGKTSCVQYLASRLAQRGRRVAILSRGYGARVSAPYALMAKDGRLFRDDQPVAAGPQQEGSSNGAALPDEPQLLAASLDGVPVLVGRRREQTGREAINRFGPDVILLDDGFQYRRLARDCEIVLISAGMPLGGWPLLPRGPMREPLTALRRADVVILTKADQSLPALGALRERLRGINRQALIATALHEPARLRDHLGTSLGLTRLAGARVGLVSSIGDPHGFEETVRRLGAGITVHLAYPDHHRYASQEWQAALRAVAGSGASALLTTEKDLARLRPIMTELLPVPVWVLGIRLAILEGEAELDARLARVWTG